MKTHHTPGPWRVTIHGFHMIKVESKDRVIFDGFHGEEANAQLAAAAPELYYALIAMLNRDDLSCYAKPMLNQALSAIAKATGQTT